MHETLEMHILQDCEAKSDFCACKGMELGEAYVREQPLDCIFKPEEGLMMGTAFPNLSKPYGGWRKVQPC